MLNQHWNALSLLPRHHPPKPYKPHPFRLQVSRGVTLEQARELRAPYAAYCARLEELGAESAAALATVQEVQQASWGGASWGCLC